MSDAISMVSGDSISNLKIGFTTGGFSLTSISIASALFSYNFPCLSSYFTIKRGIVYLPTLSAFILYVRNFDSPGLRTPVQKLSPKMILKLSGKLSENETNFATSLPSFFSSIFTSSSSPSVIEVLLGLLLTDKSGTLSVILTFNSAISSSISGILSGFFNFDFIASTSGSNHFVSSESSSISSLFRVSIFFSKSLNLFSINFKSFFLIFYLLTPPLARIHHTPLFPILPSLHDIPLFFVR